MLKGRLEAVLEGQLKLRSMGLVSFGNEGQGKMQLYRHELDLIISLMEGQIGTPAQRNSIKRILTDLKKKRKGFIFEKLMAQFATMSSVPPYPKENRSLV